MSSSSLRAAAAARVSRGTGLRSAILGRSGGSAAVVASRGRSASSSTSAASAGNMEQPKQQTQQQDVVSGDKNTRDGGAAHKGHWDPITHSFGEGYATRADEEGFGTVYARGDDEDRPGHHPEYDTSQGCVVKEKEKGRHFKDDKHAA